MSKNSKLINASFTLPPGLFTRLDGYAQSRSMCRSEVIRWLIERALGGDPVTHRSIENAIRYIHVAVDHILLHGYGPEVVAQVEELHRELVMGANPQLTNGGIDE